MGEQGELHFSPSRTALAEFRSQLCYSKAVLILVKCLAFLFRDSVVLHLASFVS